MFQGPIGEDSPVKGKKKNLNNPLVPLVISQIHNATQLSPEDEEFFIDGRPVSTISIIGQIISSNQATHLVCCMLFFFTDLKNYVIDDGTGQIDVRIWVDAQEPNPILMSKSELWNPGVYVKVVGSIRAFGNRKSIAGHNIVVLYDFNQLVYHQLDVIYAHVQNTSNGKPPISNQPTSMNQSIAVAATTGNQPQTSESVLRSLYQNVFDYVCRVQNPPGASVSEIYQYFAEVATESDIREIVKYLADEGHLYPVDDQHYAATVDPAGY